MIISGLVEVFNNQSALIEWLESKRWDCEGPEEFNEWLLRYFDRGNEIMVNDESYDYLDCVELI